MPLRRSGTSFHYLFAASCSVSSMLLSIQYPKLNGTVPCQGRKGLFSAVINPRMSITTTYQYWFGDHADAKEAREEKKEEEKEADCTLCV